MIRYKERERESWRRWLHTSAGGHKCLALLVKKFRKTLWGSLSVRRLSSAAKITAEYQQSETLRSLDFELRFVTKNALKFSPKALNPLCCGSEKNPVKFPAYFPQNFPANRKFTDELLQERKGEEKTFQPLSCFIFLLWKEDRKNPPRIPRHFPRQIPRAIA